MHVEAALARVESRRPRGTPHRAGNRAPRRDDAALLLALSGSRVYSGRRTGTFEMQVCLRINGEKRTFERAPTIAEILERLNVPRDAVAVEVNRSIVPRSTHGQRRLEDGDEVEIVTFVGGG